MNLAFKLNDPKALLVMYQLGYKNNKKPGEGLAEEAIETARRHPDWIEILGNTEMDVDMLAGELRDANPGLKILNVEELKRKIINDNQSN